MDDSLDDNAEESASELSTEFFKCLSSTPRGLEAYVPALVRLRVEYWRRFSPQLRSLLEIADYIGLDRARELTIADFEDLWYTLPGFIWTRAAAAMQTHDREAGMSMFIDDAGRPLSSYLAFHQLAQAIVSN